jgi:hypothetical protein
MLDHRAQADPRQVEKTTCQFSVEEVIRTQAVHGKAGHVLRGGVKNPLGSSQRLGERLEADGSTESEGIDEVCARSVSA